MKAPRDHRLDIVRGLALIAIFIDHVNNAWLFRILPQGWQACDFAEVFVFLSGWAAGLAYEPLLRERGFPALTAKAMRRILMLYRWHIGTAAAALGLVHLAFVHGIAITQPSMALFEEAPRLYLLRALYFGYAPYVLSVLPLYVVLMMLLPGILWLGNKSWPSLAALSIAIYVSAHWLTPAWLQLPIGNHPAEAWAFQPSCWQLAFVGGYLVPKITWPAWMRSRGMAGLGATIIIAAAALTLGHLYGPLPELKGSEKGALGAARIINFAGWILLVQPFWKHLPDLRPLATCGRHSLELFCIGACLSVVGAISIEATHANEFMQLVIVLCGALALVLIAYRLDGWTAQRKAPSTQPLRQ